MRVDVRAEKCELRIEKSSEYIIPGPSLCGILSPKDFRGLRSCQQPGIPAGASTWDSLARVLPGRDCLFSVGLGFLVLFTRLCQACLGPPHRGGPGPGKGAGASEDLLLDFCHCQTPIPIPSGGRGGDGKAQARKVTSGAKEAASRPAGNKMVCEA